MNNTIVRHSLNLGLLGLAALVCTGCPNPQTYGTPRTTPAGKLSHSVAVEAIGISATDGETDEEVSATAPNLPTYTLRIGLADQLDMGVRAANMSSIGADLKWNFIKSEVFDMAIDPGFQFASLTVGEVSTTLIYSHVPLLLGINAGETLTIVPTVGVSHGFATTSVAQDSASGSTGLMARFGLGLDIRVGKRFALHPEFTALKIVDDESGDEGLIYFMGLGFNFGNLPNYGAGAPADE
jgi:hypothetical protein